MSESERAWVEGVVSALECLENILECCVRVQMNGQRGIISHHRFDLHSIFEVIFHPHKLCGVAM